MAKSLKRIALIVTFGTLLSKAGGMARQLVIAGAFGVGAAYDAYNYAYILPGFLLILLGGINGPFHSAMVSVLSRRPKQEGAHILAALNTMVGAALLLITLLMVIGAKPLINIVGPGLSPEIQRIAVLQLQLMAPMALLAGFIGLGFGSLTATDEFWIPAVSPIMSSLAIISGIGIFWLQFGPGIGTSELALRGGIILALSTLIGSLLQWLIQIPSLIRKGLARMSLVWDWGHPGVKEVWKVIGPATLSSGMLQINVCTDLFFASEIVGAAAGLSYASLLVQAPLGLISNALLVPLLPTFAKLTSHKDKPALIARVRQGLMLSSASMIALGSLFIVLGTPIVALIYERGAFDNKAVSLVSGILIAYGVGMPAYLGRDVLVRVFYAIGDGTTPFRLSTAGIGLNIIFDWFLVGGPTPWGHQIPFNFGAPGLVLATALINLLSCIALLFILSMNLGGLPLRQWLQDLCKLLSAGLTSGLVTLVLKEVIIWPQNFPGLLIEVGICSLASLGVFGLISNMLGIKEVTQIITILHRKITP